MVVRLDVFEECLKKAKAEGTARRRLQGKSLWIWIEDSKRGMELQYDNNIIILFNKCSSKLDKCIRDMSLRKKVYSEGELNDLAVIITKMVRMYFPSHQGVKFYEGLLCEEASGVPYTMEYREKWNKMTGRQKSLIKDIWKHTQLQVHPFIRENTEDKILEKKLNERSTLEADRKARRKALLENAEQRMHEIRSRGLYHNNCFYIKGDLVEMNSLTTRGVGTSDVLVFDMTDKQICSFSEYELGYGKRLLKPSNQNYDPIREYQKLNFKEFFEYMSSLKNSGILLNTKADDVITELQILALEKL